MGGTRYAQANKIKRLPNGALVASCGSLVQCAKLLTFLEENDGEWTADMLKACPDASAIYVRSDGKVILLEGGKRGGAASLEGEFFADGSGYVAALAAMKAGADAVRAIEIAAELDTSTSPPVVSFRLSDNPPPVPKKKRKNARGKNAR